MFKKVLEFLKGVGQSTLVRLLPLAETYLADQIKKAEGKIGDTPEAQARFVMSHVENFLKERKVI